MANPIVTGAIWLADKAAEWWVQKKIGEAFDSNSPTATGSDDGAGGARPSHPNEPPAPAKPFQPGPIRDATGFDGGPHHGDANPYVPSPNIEPPSGPGVGERRAEPELPPEDKALEAPDAPDPPKNNNPTGKSVPFQILPPIEVDMRSDQPQSSQNQSFQILPPIEVDMGTDPPQSQENLSSSDAEFDPNFDPTDNLDDAPAPAFDANFHVSHDGTNADNMSNLFDTPPDTSSNNDGATQNSHFDTHFEITQPPPPETSTHPEPDNTNGWHDHHH